MAKCYQNDVFRNGTSFVYHISMIFCIILSIVKHFERYTFYKSKSMMQIHLKWDTEGVLSPHNDTLHLGHFVRTIS